MFEASWPFYMLFPSENSYIKKHQRAPGPECCTTQRTSLAELLGMKNITPQSQADLCHIKSSSKTGKAGLCLWCDDTQQHKGDNKRELKRKAITLLEAADKQLSNL